MNQYKEVHEDHVHHENCHEHSAHELRLHHIEQDIHMLKNATDKFKNNILLMSSNVALAIIIAVLQFILMYIKVK